MNAIVTCVEYDDILALTLPRNAHHFDKVLVVTAPQDRKTEAVVASVENAERWPTNAFYRDGCHFNKGAAIEEGFDVLGREGWICVIDADVVMPHTIGWPVMVCGFLYVPHRRMCPNIGPWDANWTVYPTTRDRDHAGFCQFFHADDPALREKPWYGVRWIHAGGCDSDFQGKWPPDHRVWLPFDVLHLGMERVNWCGRVTPRSDGTIHPEARGRRKALNNILAGRRKAGYKQEYIGYGRREA